MTLWHRVLQNWDRAAAVVAAFVGGVVLVVGWFGISDTPYPAEQLPYFLSAGIGGLFLLGIGATLWLSADLSDEWRKLDRIDDGIRAIGGVQPAAPETAAQPSRARADGMDRAGV